MVIDLTSFNDFIALPADQLLNQLFWMFGWIPIAIVFLVGSGMVFLFTRQIIFSKTLRFTFLAVDIPRGNEQSLKAVEALFTYLAGAHDDPDLIEKYWEGRYQLGFSFEIVGIEGYTQFVIRTPAPYRDLLETAVYATYPDAEITEINDYTEGIPAIYPNDEYDVWGGEMILVKPDIYPLKPWKEFEVQSARPRENFKDPLATLLDMYSSLKKGEQFWFQIIVYPTGFDWPERGDKEISKIIGEKVKADDTLLQTVMSFPAAIVDTIVEILFGITFSAVEAKKEEKDSFKMMNLKPKQKKQIEAIQEKISKLGFSCKLRFVYVAKKEVMNKPKAVFGIVGWIKQFLDLDLNNFKPDMAMTATSAHYFFVDYRKNIKKNKIVSAYRDRTGTRGRKRFILTAEELATLWHFPIETQVKAPLIQKTAGKKAEPPMTLPFADMPAGRGITTAEREQFENIFEDLNELQESVKDEAKPEKQKIEENIFAEAGGEISDEKEGIKGGPPANLPFA